MKLIRFDANRLPFKPLMRQVIYFDASPLSMKMSYHVPQLIDRYYSEICRLFTAEGLEFCFLPRISRSLHLPELLSYFRPDLPPERRDGYLQTVTAENLARYFANEEDFDDYMPMGLIKYTGQRFGDDYIFSYMPIRGRTEEELLMAVKYYLQFNSDRSEQYSYRHFPDDAISNSMMASESAACQVEDSSYDINTLLSQAQQLVQQLRDQGVNDLVIEEIFHPTQRLSRLHVRYSRIFLPDYQNMEIKMTPLPKALFLLYLKHPEGIRFCDLPDYRDELLHIYASFSGRDNMDDIRASIDDLTNPLSNSINEKCSRIRQAFLSKFEDRLARNYYITGPRGEIKKILLPRELVTWEQ